VKATLRHSPIEKPIELHLETSRPMYFLIETLTSLVKEKAMDLVFLMAIETLIAMPLLMVIMKMIATLTSLEKAMLTNWLILIRLLMATNWPKEKVRETNSMMMRETDLEMKISLVINSLIKMEIVMAIETLT
jgi:hypothetical protein